MDKKRAIHILTKSAQLYKEHLEDRKLLFVYGVPSDINRQLKLQKQELNGLNVPNTFLNKDIRDITASPIKKIYAIFSKSYREKQYSVVQKLDKAVNLQTCSLGKEIDDMIDMENVLSNER